MSIMKISQDFLDRCFKKKRGIKRKVFLFAALALVLWAVSVVCAVFFVSAKTLEARDYLLETKARALEFDFVSAGEALGVARKSLSLSRKVLPILYSVCWLPNIGRELKLSSDLIRSMGNIADALDPIFVLWDDITRLSGISRENIGSITFDELPSQTKRAVLNRLAGSADDLDLLAVRVELARESFEEIAKESSYGPIVSATVPVREGLAAIGKWLELPRILARTMPTFAGLSEPSTNLLLFINNDELRPGGGFIGTYGILKTYGGDIQELETVDVYALDDVVADSVAQIAPAPLIRYNQAAKWFFRDANWSPDFAVSSQKAVELFLSEAALLDAQSDIPVSRDIDGIIALTPTYASDLLAITGPISVGGQTFTKDNVADLIEYQVEVGYAKEGLPVTQRKEILSDLINEMKSRLYALPLERLNDVALATQKAFRSKQLFLFSKDEQAQEIIKRANLGGVIEPETVDSIMVVDANLASLKSDPVVKREIKYSMTRSESGDWLGKVDVTYKHTGAFDWKTTRYRTYTRLLAPKGSLLVKVDGALANDKIKNPSGAPGIADISEELNMASFGAFTSVEPGQEHVLSFVFTLSPAVVNTIKNGKYDLTFFKQAGARDYALTLDLDFDKNVARAAPSENENEWGDDTYRLNTILDQDFMTQVIF
jgi:hypothetical protein